MGVVKFLLLTSGCRLLATILCLLLYWILPVVFFPRQRPPLSQTTHSPTVISNSI